MSIVCGNVEAKVNYTKSEKIYYKQNKKINTGEKENKIQIKFNNFQINFYKTLSKFKIYDTIYSEQNLKIFSNFYLPISIVKVTNIEQVEEQKNYSKEDAISIAKEILSKKLEQEIENKENILGTEVNVEEAKDYIKVYLTYDVIENIESYEKIEY